MSKEVVPAIMAGFFAAFLLHFCCIFTALLLHFFGDFAHCLVVE